MVTSRLRDFLLGPALLLLMSCPHGESPLANSNVQWTTNNLPFQREAQVTS